MELETMDPHSQMILDLSNNNKLFSENVYTAFKTCNNGKTSYTKCSACVITSTEPTASSPLSDLSSNDSSSSLKETKRRGRRGTKSDNEPGTIPTITTANANNTNIKKTSRTDRKTRSDSSDSSMLSLGSISPLTLNTNDSRMILTLWPSNDTKENIARISVFVSSIHGKTFYGQLNLTDEVLMEHFGGLPGSLPDYPERAGALLFSKCTPFCSYLSLLW